MWYVAALADTERATQAADGPAVPRSRSAYIRGAALNALPSYDVEAEELLSRAVKLAPTCVGAWNELGECLWKKGDLAAARHCFDGSLAQRRNAAALRSLSMVLRKLGSSPREKVALMDESVESAKAAVALDVQARIMWQKSCDDAPFDPHTCLAAPPFLRPSPFDPRRTPSHGTCWATPTWRSSSL